MSSWEIARDKAAKQLEKQTYEWRRDQIIAARDKISDASDNPVNGINSKIDECTEDLATGIKGIGCLDALALSMHEKKEVSGTSDVRLNAYYLKLCSEIGDCNCKIDALESEISKLEQQYQQAVEAEERARREALEAAIKRFNELMEF